MKNSNIRPNVKNKNILQNREMSRSLRKHLTHAWLSLLIHGCETWNTRAAVEEIIVA